MPRDPRASDSFLSGGKANLRRTSRAPSAAESVSAHSDGYQVSGVSVREAFPLRRLPHAARGSPRGPASLFHARSLKRLLVARDSMVPLIAETPGLVFAPRIIVGSARAAVGRKLPRSEGSSDGASYAYHGSWNRMDLALFAESTQSRSSVVSASKSATNNDSPF